MIARPSRVQLVYSLRSTHPVDAWTFRLYHGAWNSAHSPVDYCRPRRRREFTPDYEEVRTSNQFTFSILILDLDYSKLFQTVDIKTKRATCILARKQISKAKKVPPGLNVIDKGVVDARPSWETWAVVLFCFLLISFPNTHVFLHPTIGYFFAHIHTFHGAGNFALRTITNFPDSDSCFLAVLFSLVLRTHWMIPKPT